MLHNYAYSKLLIDYPSVHNGIILSLLLIIIVVTTRKTERQFFGLAQTQQLKGLAILAVIVGHLWIHVSAHRAVPILGTYAVGLFLFLSGYGLSVSWGKRRLGVQDYVKHRIVKIMLPYWIVTIIWLIMDQAILGKTYSWGLIASTFAGLNVSEDLQYIDYSRWFITILLVYYVLFYLANRMCSPMKAAGVLCGFAFVMMLCWPGGDRSQLLAFPLGCIVACNKERLEGLFSRGGIISAIVAILAGVILMAIVNDYVSKTAEDADLVKHAVVGIDVVRRILVFLLPVCVFCVLGQRGYASTFLGSCGAVSYEMYLLHGPLLIKYNPVFGLVSARYVCITFMAYLVGLLLVSRVFSAGNSWLYSHLSRVRWAKACP